MSAGGQNAVRRLAGRGGMRLARSLVLSMVAAACLLAAVLLAGVALMLNATAPAAAEGASWWLVAAPLAPMVVSATCMGAVVRLWRRPSLVRNEALWIASTGVR